MESGGFTLLLQFLLDYDLAGLDVNEAPSTIALLEQKHASLEPIYQWWLDCLTEGYLVGSDIGTTWPAEVETERFRNAFKRYTRDRNIRTRVPDSRAIGHMLKKCTADIRKHRVRRSEDLMYLYLMSSLERNRDAWERFIGHKVVWE